MDPYFKKEIEYEFRGEHLKFDVAHTLFSTYDIDHGTELFLKTIEIGNAKTILDMGCGYGTIGLCIAKKYPDTHVTMLDRDLLAVRYAQLNARKK
jgi:16S rRNA G1207 methylase RsmC